MSARKLPDMQPLLLPQVQPWKDAKDVEAYACACLQTVGLGNWSFGWDKTIRRIGCCKPRDKRISISIHFVQKFVVSQPELIRRTVLHELAHALSWNFNSTSGHDATWHRFCTKLGIPDEKSCTACPSFVPEEKARRRIPRYVLCHAETGEVFHRYFSAPRTTMRRVKQLYIRGRKDETLGKLVIRPYTPE